MERSKSDLAKPEWGTQDAREDVFNFNYLTHTHTFLHLLTHGHRNPIALGKRGAYEQP